MPTEDSLAKLAPEKDVRAIRRTMGRLRLKLDEAQEAARAPPTRQEPPRFAPAGQSTQMIVGADAANDQTILDTSANLYGAYRLKRVYYSAFSPIPDASRALPLARAAADARAPALPGRLADALLRFRRRRDRRRGRTACCRSTSIRSSPGRCGTATASRSTSPRASREELLRVPGFGTKAVDRIIATRRMTSIRVADLARLHIPRDKALPFIVLSDHRPCAASARRQRG